MRKLSLNELKEMSSKVTALQNLDSIKGGAMAECHTKEKEGNIVKEVRPGQVRPQ